MRRSSRTGVCCFLVKHGLDCTCSNCTGVDSKEFSVLTMIGAIDKHKAEVRREYRVDRCQATGAVTSDGIGSGDRDFRKDLSGDAPIYCPSKVSFSIESDFTQDGQRSDRRDRQRGSVD
jgi:hypothetical protein